MSHHVLCGRLLLGSSCNSFHHQSPLPANLTRLKKSETLAREHQASGDDVRTAIQAAAEAQRDWSQWSFEERAAVFLKAADLLAGPWRQKPNAATMLGQSKTAHQAEIDSACELIDFLRWNVAFARDLQQNQPVSPAGMRNALEYRPLEGFVYAVTPFNFTAIGGNLACAPALMGNSVLWKPAATAALSNYFAYELLEAARLPSGVINFVPGEAQTVSSVVLGSRFNRSSTGGSGPRPRRGRAIATPLSISARRFRESHGCT